MESKINSRINIYRKRKNLTLEIREMLSILGWGNFIKRVLLYGLKKIVTYWDLIIGRFIFHPKQSLWYKNKALNYFYHSYNATYRNERAIEIPIIIDEINNFKNESILLLEIGNVLSHYFKSDHDIVDKFEKAPGIINSDILDFQPTQKYTIIVSISTLEHIGWDDTNIDPKKIIKVIDHLIENCLAQDGKMIFTFPYGYNPYLDSYVRRKKLKFNQYSYYKKVKNKWITCTFSQLTTSQYSEYKGALGLIIAYFN